MARAGPCGDIPPVPHDMMNLFPTTSLFSGDLRKHLLYFENQQTDANEVNLIDPDSHLGAQGLPHTFIPADPTAHDHSSICSCAEPHGAPSRC